VGGGRFTVTWKCENGTFFSRKGWWWWWW